MSPLMRGSSGENGQIKVEVELDNSLIISHVSSLDLIQRIDWHHEFEVKAPLDTIEGRQEFSLNKTQSFVGKTIKVALKNHNGDEQYHLFKGVITEISLSRHSGTASDLLIRGYSPTILMDAAPTCSSYVDRTLKQIVQENLSHFPRNLLSWKVDNTVDPKYLNSIQYNESVYNYLSRLAQDNAQWFYYNGTDVIFGKLESGENVPLNFGHELVSFETSLKMQPAKFSLSAYDYLNDAQMLSKSSSGNVQGLDAWGKKAASNSDSLYSMEGNMVYASPVDSDNSLAAAVKNRKAAIAADFVLFTGVSDHPGLKVGGKITVEGGSKAAMGNDNLDYGSFTVIKVTHHADGMGRYQNRFEAIPSSLSVPPLSHHVRLAKTENQPAVVIDNKDPEGLGRVKVKFKWAEPNNLSHWMRCVTPHAGKDRGYYFVPEIEEQVMIAFEADNIDRPFVVGSLYHAKSNSSDKKEGNNYIKSIRTVSGNEIQFNDKDGEETIHIYNKDMLNEVLITMKDDGLIRIVSNKNIQVIAQENIEVQSKNMTFEASEKIEFKAKEFIVGAKSKLELDSEKAWSAKGMDVTVQANSNLKMSANKAAELKSNATVEISGQAKTTVSASGQLELTASAQASLKAGIVMIN